MRKPCWFWRHRSAGRLSGGAGAAAPRRWRVRALWSGIPSAGAAALAARGAELVVGTFEDRAAMRSAMAGVDGVFSVQPSSPGVGR